MMLGNGIHVGRGRGVSVAGGGVTPWWLAGGISPANVVAAYQPKGAASLAASYVNLANPGTYNAAPGVAPTFAAATGWTFNGSTQYLETGIVPATDQSWSAIVRFSCDALGKDALFGLNINNANQRFEIYAALGSTQYSYQNGSTVTVNAARLTSSVMGFAGNKAYRNGVEDATIPAGAAHATTHTLVLGATRYVPNSNLIRFLQGTWQCGAFYNAVLTAGQMAALTTAMNAL